MSLLGLKMVQVRERLICIYSVARIDQLLQNIAYNRPIIIIALLEYSKMHEKAYYKFIVCEFGGF